MEGADPVLPTSQSTQGENKERNPYFKWLSGLEKKSLSNFEIFCFVMMLVVGSQNVSWNSAYKGGFWSAFIDVGLNGLGYFCLCLCMAEMSSALPFSGGIYGFVRATSGPFWGYMVACFELLMNVSFVCASFQFLGEIPHKTKAMNSANTPIFVFFLYLAALSITLVGGKPFWIISCLLGLTSLFIILIFIFGSFPNADLGKYGNLSEPPTSYHVMTYMFVSSSQYMGIQYIPLLGHLCKDPRTQVPHMMMISVIVCVLTAMFVLVFAAAHYPGTYRLSYKSYPLTWDFAPVLSGWLNLPALFGSNVGLIYCYGRQISGISKTGLLPSILQESIPYLGTPYVALLMGVMICFTINMAAIYYPYILDKFAKLSTLAAGFVYISACVSYILFKKNFSVLQRSFYNPIREVAAVIGIGVFLMVMVSVVFYQGPTYYTATATASYGIACALFYILYWHKHQAFSEEEKQHMFKAYLINGKNLHEVFESPLIVIIANREKRNRIKNRLAAGTGKDPSSQNKASSQQNKLTSNLFTNKVAPEVLTNKDIDNQPTPSLLNPTADEVEETAPAYKFRTEVLPSSERLPAIEERRASLTSAGGVGLAEPTGLLSAASSVVNLAAGLMSYLSIKSRAVNQGHSIHRRDGANTSGKSLGSVLSRASAISKKSVLSEYQEMAIIQAGGLIDGNEEEEEDVPAVFPSMAAHLHFQPPAPTSHVVEVTPKQPSNNRDNNDENGIARTNTDELV